MSSEAQQLTSALEQWESQYQAGREKLNLQELHALRALLVRLVEQVDRDATGPSSLVTPPSE